MASPVSSAAAITSSFRNRPLPAGTAVFGEVGLGGELRSAGQSALRIREAAQMGFRRCIVPSRSAPPDAEGIEHHVSDETLEAFQRLVDERSKD